MITNDLIDKFNTISNYPLDDFFNESRSFFDNDYVNIFNFFSGNIETLDKANIKKLNKLVEQSVIISNIFQDKKRMFNTVDFWELLNTFEDIKTKLQTTIKIPKYVRSSIIANNNKSGFVFDYNLSSEQTLENITTNILNEKNQENSWTKIALENDLKEVDYDIIGGKNLKLRKRIFQNNIVTSMIDYTIGEKIYGKDLKRFLTFKNDDLEVLEYKETAIQSAEILSTLTKGDIPEFENLGIDSSVYKGSNYSQLNYPSIVRELKRNFQTDDLFVDFQIKSFRLEDGDIFIEYSIGTKYDLVIIKNITI